MRIGVFGGTFDPTHAGHLAVARAARDALQLDLVELIPLHSPPHRGRPVASPADRIAMLRMACSGESRLVASAREIDRGGVSYTVDTLEEIARERPGDDLFLVIGADSYDELPTWRASSRVQDLAHLAVIPRPGGHGAARLRSEDIPRLLAPGQAPPADGKAVYAVPMAPVPIAARDLRARLARGEDPGPDLPHPVFGYIRRRGLYNWPSAQERHPAND